MQISIIEKIKMVEEGDHPDKDKEIFGILLNLARPEESMVEMELIRFLQDYPVEWYKKVVANGVGGLSALSQLPFTAASGVSVARLFSDPTSAGAITAGVISSMMAFLPTVGLGFKGGKKVGEQLFVDHPSLGTIVNPALRDTLKWLVLGINLIAGGTLVAFTYNAAKDFANLMKLSAEATRILELSLIGVALVGSTIAFGQYLIDAMDELVVFLAKQNGSQESRRLIDFITGYTRLINVVETMNVENYRDLMANWKLAGKSDAARTLHAIFSEQLSDPQYLKLQQDLTAAYDVTHGLNDSHTVVLDDRLVKDTYIVSPSFLDRHQGLRRRRPVRDDVEMQYENAYKIGK